MPKKLLIILISSLLITSFAGCCFTAIFLSFDYISVKVTCVVSFIGIFATNAYFAFDTIRINKKEIEDSIKYELAHIYRNKFDKHYAEFLKKYSDTLVGRGIDNHGN